MMFPTVEESFGLAPQFHVASFYLLVKFATGDVRKLFNHADMDSLCFFSLLLCFLFSLQDNERGRKNISVIAFPAH